MATVTTTIVPAPDVFPYSGMPDVYREKTGIPRGEISFDGQSVDVTIATGGDVQKLVIECILPQGYSYVLREMFLSYAASDADEWADDGWAGLQDSETNSLRKTLMPFALTSKGFLPINTPRKVWTPEWLPRQVVYPIIPQEGAKLEIILANAVIDGAAGFISFNVRFLQFDVEQANNYALNYPIPTR